MAELLTAPTAIQFLEAWNSVPNFHRARLLSPDRMKQFLARCRELDWVQNWQEALDTAARSAFCNGHNERGWKATIDWFLRPGVLTKILEGRYFKIGTRPDTKSKEEIEEEHYREQLRLEEMKRQKEEKQREIEASKAGGKTFREALKEFQDKKKNADPPTVGDVLRGS